MNQKIHPMTIIQGFREACEVASRLWKTLLEIITTTSIVSGRFDEHRENDVEFKNFDP